MLSAHLRMTLSSSKNFAHIIALSFGFFASIHGDPLDRWTITQPETPFAGNFSSLAYGNGIFIAAASSGADGGWIGYSVDAIHWSSGTCGGQPCTPPALSGTTFANGRFVAVGAYGWTYSSTNGADWRVSVVPPSDSLLWDVCYGNGNFVAVGGMDSCPCGFVAVSTDGQNWNPNYVESSLELRGVAYGNGTFVAVGRTDYGATASRFDIFSTTNPAAPWTAHAILATNDLFAVAYGNNVFVAVGHEHYTGEGCILSSGDGSSWTRRSLPSTNGLQSVSYVQAMFIVTGTSGTLLTSTNGIDWRVRPSGTRNSLGHSVYANGTVWIADAAGTLLRSDPLLSLRIAMGVQPELTVFGVEGRNCRIEATSDPGATIWPEVANFVLYNSPTIWRDGTTADCRARFYRAVLLP